MFNITIRLDIDGGEDDFDLLDKYDVVSNLEYEERLLLREKLETICYDILHNDIDSDDFKVQVINNYFKYL